MQDVGEVHKAYKKIKLLYPSVDHMITAYSTQSDWGYHGDGEYGAGHKMLQTSKLLKHTNITMFVIRIYGNVHLGPNRHNIIESCVNQALDKLQQ